MEAAALLSSTSHRNPISAFPDCAKLLRSLWPFPPTPIPAIINRSLGAKNPGPPITCRGTIITPVATRALFLMKSLLDAGVVFFLLNIIRF